MKQRIECRREVEKKGREKLRFTELIRSHHDSVRCFKMIFVLMCFDCWRHVCRVQMFFCSLLLHPILVLTDCELSH